MISCCAKRHLTTRGDKLTKVYETDRAYLAPEMATNVDKRGVRISKTILQREIPPEQARKLFVEGKTDLMPGFLSKKGRKFAAHLKLNRTSGKLEFEFAPRKSKAKDGDKDATNAASAEGSDGADTSPAKTPAKKKAAPKKKTAKKRTAKKK